MPQVVGTYISWSAIHTYSHQRLIRPNYILGEKIEVKTRAFVLTLILI
jgi:hypothetical protein